MAPTWSMSFLGLYTMKAEMCEVRESRVSGTHRWERTKSEKVGYRGHSGEKERTRDIRCPWSLLSSNCIFWRIQEKNNSTSYAIRQHDEEFLSWHQGYSVFPGHLRPAVTEIAHVNRVRVIKPLWSVWNLKKKSSLPYNLNEGALQRAETQDCCRTCIRVSLRVC